MSFMNPVDLVEEDAADLQFPKAEQEPDPVFAVSEISSRAAKPISAADAVADIKDIKRKSYKVIKVKPTTDTKYITAFYDPQVLSEATQEVIDKTLLTSASTENCYSCKSALEEPYIKCAECFVLLCRQCFAQGREKLAHRNTHSYIVVRDDIQIFAGNGCWTAREERLLLTTLQASGYGNWEAVAKALNGQRTPDECRQHYHDCYFGGIFERALGLTHASQTYFPQRMPYVMKMRSVDPPRCDDYNAMQSQIMAGYRCARGDFDTPYDRSAESFLTVINDYAELWDEENENKDDDETGWSELLVELRCALVRAYNNRLKERQRRYRIMRDYGLIMPNRTLGWISKYAEAFGSEANCSRFLAFMQITKPIEFDMLIESMKYFTDLRKSILRLYEMRKNGIRTLAGGELYFKLKKKRLMAQRERAKLQQMYDWRKLVSNAQGAANLSALNNAMPPQNVRKKAGPMDISALPGYAKLNDAERELCSQIRLYPQNYMDYKNLLISENMKIGHLRLADARRLIKIDVNKTRQLYDFLIEHGHINKPT